MARTNAVNHDVGSTVAVTGGNAARGAVLGGILPALGAVALIAVAVGLGFGTVALAGITAAAWTTASGTLAALGASALPAIGTAIAGSATLGAGITAVGSLLGVPAATGTFAAIGGLLGGAKGAAQVAHEKGAYKTKLDLVTGAHQAAVQQQMQIVQQTAGREGYEAGLAAGQQAASEQVYAAQQDGMQKGAQLVINKLHEHAAQQASMQQAAPEAQVQSFAEKVGGPRVAGAGHAESLMQRKAEASAAPQVG